MPVTALISKIKNIILFVLCRYAQSCAFISVIELPRIPAYHPKLMKNNLAFMNWKEIIDEVSYQTHFTDVDFVFPGTAFGKWIPRSSNAHLQIYAGIIAGELKKQGPVTVCAVLNDEKDQRTDKYENEWNGLWHFTNIMQFSEQFIAVSSTGLQNMNYVALPIVDTFSTPFDEATVGMAVSDGWTELLKSEMAQLFEEERRSCRF